MSHLRQLRRDTRQLLDTLGSSPDEVAGSLEAAGVRGVHRSNRHCPVALYVTAVVGSEPSVHSIAVGTCSLQITLVRPEDRRPAGRLQVQLPKPVRQFVALFDHNRYPGVVRAPVAVPTPAGRPPVAGLPGIWLTGRGPDDRVGTGRT